MEAGEWGTRSQIFFGSFYGEAIELAAGQAYTRPVTDRPYGGIVWSGSGSLNGAAVAVRDYRKPPVEEVFHEFLVTPGGAFALRNTGTDILRVYVVFPIGTNPDDVA